MPYSPEQIQDRYDKLPQEIRQAMDSVDTTSAVVDVGQKYDLMYDQITELVDEVGLIMLGLVPSSMFVDDVSRRTRVDMSKAMLIARDVNTEVFDKMRDSLKNIQASTETKAPVSDKLLAEAGIAPRQMGEKTIATDAQEAVQNSVVRGIEAAGGFVIDKPAEDRMNHLESKEEVLGEIEKDTSLPPDHMLEDHPEAGQGPGPSIVDTLLAKGVAMPMDAGAPKKEEKLKPYDGVDPYREPIE